MRTPDPGPTAAIAEILLDVEGTTTPLAFVHDVLFPYARLHLESYLVAAPAEAAIRDHLIALTAEYAADRERGLAPPEPPPPTGNATDRRWAARYAHWLMQADRKSTPLKAIQGLIWQDGYARGEIQGAVFADVAAALARWNGRGLAVSIYSSGSVLAQELLFRNSTAGDLARYLAAHYDTRIGGKREAASYAAIAADRGRAPQTILFVSDVVAELDAARAAGLATRLSLRPGNQPEPAHDHPSIQSFAELFP